MEKTKKGDFIDLRFTGYSNGTIFDSNSEEDLKSVAPGTKTKRLVVVVGKKMVIEGLDEALENKETEKEYEVHISHKKGFGQRKKELVKTMPLKIFTAQRINPQPGMTLFLDSATAKVIAVSGARVLADFNNPLAGKDLLYKFKINKILSDEKEKITCVFEYFIGFVPEFDLRDKVVIRGPKEFERLVEMYDSKFAEIVGKNLGFELKEKVESAETIKAKSSQKN